MNAVFIYLSFSSFLCNSNTLATWCEELTHLRRPWCWERLRAGGEGTTEDEVVGWHHRLDGHRFGWTLGVGDGQGGLVCCSSWGRKELDTTEWLNWTELTNKIIWNHEYIFLLLIALIIAQPLLFLLAMINY